MKKLVLAVVGLVILIGVIGALSSGGDDKPGAVSAPAASDASVLASARLALQAARDGKADWADSVKSISVDSGQVTVETSIYPDGDAKAGNYGERICNTFRSTTEGATRVRVMDSTGGVLKSCSPV